VKEGRCYGIVFFVFNLGWKRECCFGSFDSPSCLVISKPMPLPPPVINATLPAKTPGLNGEEEIPASLSILSLFILLHYLLYRCKSLECPSTKGSSSFLTPMNDSSPDVNTSLSSHLLLLKPPCQPYLRMMMVMMTMMVLSSTRMIIVSKHHPTISVIVQSQCIQSSSQFPSLLHPSVKPHLLLLKYHSHVHLNLRKTGDFYRIFMLLLLPWCRGGE